MLTSIWWIRQKRFVAEFDVSYGHPFGLVFGHLKNQTIKQLNLFSPFEYKTSLVFGLWLHLLVYKIIYTNLVLQQGIHKGFWIKLGDADYFSTSPQTRAHRDIESIDVIQWENAQSCRLKGIWKMKKNQSFIVNALIITCLV